MDRWRHDRLVVREAVFDDLDAIAKLEHDAFPDDQLSRRSLRYFLRASHRPVIAAAIDGEVAGYALVSLRKGLRSVRIYSIAVSSRFARRGVGLALLRACEAYARLRGRTGLTLEVRYDNAPAIALYEKWGFRQFGEHEDYYADGATALRLEKSSRSAVSTFRFARARRGAGPPSLLNAHRKVDAGAESRLRARLSPELCMTSSLPAHLKRLEAESIFIMREVVAEMRNPVMLYSIGKEFERHAARGAQGLSSGQAAVSAAARRHDVEVPRDDRFSRRDGASGSGLKLDRPCQSGRRPPRRLAGRLGIAGPHPGDEDRGASPGARRRTLRRGVRRRASRRGKEPRQGAHLLASLGGARLGSAQSAPGTVAAVQHAPARGRVDARLSAVELDRARRVGIHQGRRAFPSCRSIFQAAPGGRTLGRADHGRRRAAAAESRRDAAHAAGALPHARLLSAHRGDRVGGRDARRHHRRDARRDHLRAPGAADRHRRKPPRWRRRSARAISDGRRPCRRPRCRPCAS